MGAFLHEIQLDGLVGPTHNYAGLSAGNLASLAHQGKPSNPKAAAHQGLAKMRRVRELGALQGVLPPQERPHLKTLGDSLGFRGNDAEVIAAASRNAGLYLRLCSSASAMWAANSATVTPSCDAADARVHITPANLQAMFHRSIEGPSTARALRAIFSDPSRFVVHDPLPGGGQLGDEGAANHTRLATSQGSVNLFAWGRADMPAASPQRYPARQAREASESVARLHGLAAPVFAQQHPAGIDAGAFHTDVLAVGSGRFLMMHDLAFLDCDGLVADLERTLGAELFVIRATQKELPVQSAVRAYPFNSQLLDAPDGSMVIVAPQDAQVDPASRVFLDRVVASGGPVRRVEYVDVRESMQNGGGPACLRLRVPLTDDEVRAMATSVMVNDALDAALGAWIDRHYRDRLCPADLADPSLALEGMRALDELTTLLHLGSLYDFQRS